MTHVANKSKARFSCAFTGTCDRIHAQETRWQLGLRLVYYARADQTSFRGGSSYYVDTVYSNNCIRIKTFSIITCPTVLD